MTSPAALSSQERGHYLEISMRICRPLPALFLLNIVVFGVLLAWTGVPGPLLVAWGLVYLLTIGVRMAVTEAFLRQAPEVRFERSLTWWRWNCACAGVYGLMIGLTAALGFWYAPDNAWRLFWTFAPLASAACYCGSMSLGQFVPELTGQCVPVVVCWAFSGSEHAGWAMAVVGVLAAGMYMICRHFERSKFDGLRVSMQVQALSAELEARHAVLADAERQRAGMIEAASHDLRQPTQAMALLTGLLPLDRDGVLAHRLRQLARCNNAIAEMLTQLLDFHRLETGLYRPALEPVVLDPLLQELVAMQGAVSEAKGVRLEVTGPSRVVRSDGVLLRRMLMNLVSNAVKFTSSGEIRVEVRDVDGEVELSVSDTGCGMSPERLQEVTLEYIRISPGVDGTEGGLGLGLSVVKQGCRLLGHRLEISSRQGLGSRFTLRLGPAVATLEPRPHAHADIGGSAIAVVENDPLVLQSVVAMLTTWGATPVVGDGVGELQRALADEGRLPDILIADLHLSDGEDGLEAIAALRAALAEQDLPAIIVTGDLDPAIQTQAAQQNVRVAYKPLRPERLRRLIAQVLQERREATDARA